MPKPLRSNTALVPAAIAWDADGGALAPAYGDRYASASGALAQARWVFLAGSGLPGAWARQSSFTVLENGFGLGLNFLACWLAWRADAQRPRRLHYVALEAHPAPVDALLRAARHAAARLGDEAERQDLLALAQRLAAAWPVALPGLHRLEFNDPDAAGMLRLTLAFGDARQLAPRLRLGAGADALWLDGFAPQRNAPMWEPGLLKALARQTRPGGRVASWCVAASVRKALAEAGFIVSRRDGLPPKRHALTGTLSAPWLRPRALPAAPAAPAASAASAASAVVIGAGLAGALAARALAERGLQVTVLDAADAPAAGGTSALPLGLAAAHWSPDDAPLSRLSRAGLALLRQRLAQWHAALPGEPRWFDLGGIDEQAPPGSAKPAAPPGWDALPGFATSWLSTLPAGEQPAAGAAPLRRHMQAGWVRPQALVRAALAHAAIRFVSGAAVAQLRRIEGSDGSGPIWQACDAHGHGLTEPAPVVVLAQALGSAPLSRAAGLSDPADWPLAPVFGRVLHGPTAVPPSWPGRPLTHPFKRDGAFVVAAATGADGGPMWQCGATHRREPAADEAALRAAERGWLWGKLAHLANAPHAWPPEPDAGVRDWAGTRCASPDRLPLVGSLPDARTAINPSRPLAALPRLPGLYAAVALGGRGLTLAPLAAEVLAAHICHEPQPLPAELLDALDPARFYLARRRLQA